MKIRGLGVKYVKELYCRFIWEKMRDLCVKFQEKQLPTKLFF
jgi:hypothetical protein